VSAQGITGEWLTTEGLSQLLGGIPVSTIRGWRFVGIGPPHVRLGGLVRYQRAAVERWIAAGGDRRGAELKPS
jgi:predicted DNA-binding transcriptional regulator AlpA